MSDVISMKLYELTENGLKRISSTGKNDLPVGTTLELNGYNNPTYVIVKNEGANPKFSGHGTRYITVDTKTKERNIVDAYSLKFIKDKTSNMIHTYIMDYELIPEKECLRLRLASEKIIDDRHKRAEIVSNKED